MADRPEQIDSWTEWPAWHPNKELSHRHLDGLEHYLLSRDRIVDENAYGIDHADYSASFGATFHPDEEPRFWSITVGQLRAVTPSGQPIWLTGQRAEFELRNPEGQEIYVPGSKIDIYLLLNNVEGTPKISDVERKFSLKVIPAPINDAPAPEGQDLYLGRHSLQENGLRLERRPMLRRLCALGPIDEVWEEWTKVLWSRLNLFQESYCTGAVGHRAPSTVISAAILDVSREWPFLTIPQLVRKLIRINCLQETPSARLFDIVAALKEPQMEGWTGHELPKTLARLLPEPARPAIVEAVLTDFADTCRLLVEALSENIEFHAPIRLFNVWLDGLRSLSGTKQAEIENHRIESLNLNGSNDWAKAVLLITRMILGKGERTSEVSSHLAGMYAALNKRGGQASPMAFFWLVKTSTLVANFPQGGSNDLIAYCKKLGGSAAHSADRLTRYIDRVRREPGKETIQYFYLFSSSKAIPSRPGISADVHCIILGNQNTGKTALESALQKCWADVGTGSRFYIGKALPSEGFRSDNAADLLIITIAPDETDRWALDGLRAAAKDILHGSPSACVAIAYTKADEYGVVELASIRLARKGQNVGRSLRDFDQFAGGNREVGGTTQETLGPITIKAPDGVFNSIGPTRTRVLSATAQIWMDAISAGQLLNGYFIAASPAGAPDEYLSKNKERTGVMQLLGDFLAYRRKG